jgi:hypothetical protein
MKISTITSHFFIFIYITILIIISLPFTNEKIEHYAHFGDFINGVFSPMLSLLTIYFVYQSFKNQREMNKELIEDIKQQKLDRKIDLLEGEFNEVKILISSLEFDLEYPKIGNTKKTISTIKSYFTDIELLISLYVEDEITNEFMRIDGMLQSFHTSKLGDVLPRFLFKYYLLTQRLDLYITDLAYKQTRLKELSELVANYFYIEFHQFNIGLLCSFKAISETNIFITIPNTDYFGEYVEHVVDLERDKKLFSQYHSWLSYIITFYEKHNTILTPKSNHPRY